MDIQLKKYRKRAGLTQKELASMIGEKVRTYASWERGEAMLSLEQAYNCAEALGCSLNELAGLKPPTDLLSPLEQRVVDAIRSTDDGKKGEQSTSAPGMGFEIA